MKVLKRTFFSGALCLKFMLENTPNNDAEAEKIVESINKQFAGFMAAMEIGEA